MIKFIKELEEQIKEIETKAINDTYNSIWNHINIVIHELERQIPSINRFIEIYSDEEETLKMKKNDLKEINERLAKWKWMRKKLKNILKVEEHEQ